MTNEEREHLNFVASSGCVICGAPAEIHHIREYGEKRKHSKVIGLCPFHHRGAEGIHHLGKKAWRLRYGHEKDFMKDDK